MSAVDFSRYWVEWQPGGDQLVFAVDEDTIIPVGESIDGPTLADLVELASEPWGTL